MLSTQLFAEDALAIRSLHSNDKVIYEIKSTANFSIALSSSTNAISFSSARTMKRFPSPQLPPIEHTNSLSRRTQSDNKMRRGLTKNNLDIH
jgi:hypothetical protein